jgi:hypothetical protein
MSFVRRASGFSFEKEFENHVDFAILDSTRR